MASEFKPGDVVRLKSGGPAMTIEGIGQYGFDQEEKVLCVWFIRDVKKQDTFLLSSLEKDEPRQASIKTVRG
jgi:uncharacterized protein YodC (DUF2158 family)